MREPTSGLEFVWVEGNQRFWMGSSQTPGEPGFDEEAHADEYPLHRVLLTKGYWIGKHPVTNEQYSVYMKARSDAAPPQFSSQGSLNGARKPVVGVAWQEALGFVAWLNEAGQLPEGFEASLPTEAEWECAARGADGKKFPWGNEAPSQELAWYHQGARAGTDAVDNHPNGVSAFGCYDMAGNVAEWCLDAWSADYRKQVERSRGKAENGLPLVTDPYDGNHRARVRPVRGGSWDYPASQLRCAHRGRAPATCRIANIGFRVCARSK